MATIRTRQRRDGSLAYLSEVRIKRDCEIIRGLTHGRVFKYSNIEYGLGVGKTDDGISGDSSTYGRAFLQWRSSH